MSTTKTWPNFPAVVEGEPLRRGRPRGSVNRERRGIYVVERKRLRGACTYFRVSLGDTARREFRIERYGRAKAWRLACECLAEYEEHARKLRAAAAANGWRCVV